MVASISENLNTIEVPNLLGSPRQLIERIPEGEGTEDSPVDSLASSGHGVARLTSSSPYSAFIFSPSAILPPLSINSR